MNITGVPQAEKLPLQITTDRFIANLAKGSQGSPDTYEITSKKEQTILRSITRNGVWHIADDLAPFMPMSYFAELSNLIVNLNEILRN